MRCCGAARALFIGAVAALAGCDTMNESKTALFGTGSRRG
jgi:hypothetical protein